MCSASSLQDSQIAAQEVALHMRNDASTAALLRQRLMNLDLVRFSSELHPLHLHPVESSEAIGLLS